MASMLVAILFLTVAHAQPPPGYYAGLEGKQGAELRAAVHQVVTNQYSLVPPTFLDHTLALIEESLDCAGAVMTVYGGGLRATEWGLFAYDNACGLEIGWSIERFWPIGHGLVYGVLPAYDLHNMRPAVWSDIQERNLKVFGPKPKDPSIPLNAFVIPIPSTNTFQPPPSDRGLIARAMFYMDVAYEGDRRYPDLQLVDDIKLIQTNAPYYGRLSTLISWHKNSPVTDRERLRNDRVFRVQKNRNPFVDRPELVDALYGIHLSIRREGTNMVVTWPAGRVAYLNTSPSLRGGGSVRYTQTDGTNIWAVLPMATKGQFFWLENE